MSSLRAIILCRGSSPECDDQESDLLVVLEQRGWATVRTLRCAWSPTATRRARADALQLIRDGDADVLCIVAIGTVVDGVIEGVTFLADLAEAGGHLHSLEGTSTWDHGYEFLAACQQISGWAESGRSNRIKAGLETATGEGKRLGRPPAQVDPEQLRALLDRRIPKADIARRLGTNRRSLDRAIKRHGLAAIVSRLP
jgi:DNA invertase Pin-like site-specific DNA recombinase